jgi:hypothetical protein
MGSTVVSRMLTVVGPSALRPTPALRPESNPESNLVSNHESCPVGGKESNRVRNQESSPENRLAHDRLESWLAHDLLAHSPPAQQQNLPVPVGIHA